MLPAQFVPLHALASLTLSIQVQAPTRRIPSLDGLRAVSILMVIFAHASHTLNFPRISKDDPWTSIFGILGVRVFFVISGYLITTLLLKEEQRYGRISLPAFYKRRALRILPVYYFYVLIVLIVFGWMGLRAIHASTIVSALTFTTRIWAPWGGATWPLQHTWSLSIEEQFYLLWPALLVFLGARAGGRLWIPSLILTAPLLRFLARDKIVTDQIFPMQGDSIAFGCLLALAMIRRREHMERIFHFHPHLGRIAAFVLIYLRPFMVVPLARLNCDTSSLDTWFTVIGPTLQCIGIAYLIGSFTTVERGLSFKCLNLEPVQWIGWLSYSLYIWQQMVLLPREFRLLPDNWTAVRWLSSFPQNVVLVFVLASLSYYCLEKPFLSLKNRSEKKRHAAQQRPVPVPEHQP